MGRGSIIEATRGGRMRRASSGACGLGLMLVLAACTVETDPGTSFGGPPTVDTATPTPTTSATGDGSGDSAGSGDATEGLDTTAGTGPGPTDCEGMPGLGVLGGACVDGCDCASGHCFQIQLGSACSECSTDQQCMAGGSGTCSVDFMIDPPYARCTSGEMGVMCQPNSGGCQAGLVCAQIIDTMGFLPDYFCSECATSAECGAGQTCVPVVEFDGGIGAGYLHCVSPASVADGGFCPVLPDGSGDASVCVSGRCSVTDIAGLGIASIGVCSSCEVDGDCAAGQTCQPAVVDENGAVPSVCA